MSEGLIFERYLTEEVADDLLEGEQLNRVNEEYFSVLSQLVHTQALLKLLDSAAAEALLSQSQVETGPVLDERISLAEFELSQEEGELAERLQEEMKRFEIPDQSKEIDVIADLVESLVDISRRVFPASQAKEDSDCESEYAAEFAEQLTNVSDWYRATTSVIETVGGYQILDWSSESLLSLRDVHAERTIVVEFVRGSETIASVKSDPTSPAIEESITRSLASETPDLANLLLCIREANSR